MDSPTARDLLDKALKRRDELQMESKALDNLIETYQQLLRLREVSAIQDQQELYDAPTKRAAHAAQVAEMIDAARKLVISERRPMKRGELVARLRAEGHEVVGKNKNKVFGTNLWRSGKFRMIPGEGYWPKDIEFPGDRGGSLGRSAPLLDAPASEQPESGTG